MISFFHGCMVGYKSENFKENSGKLETKNGIAYLLEQLFFASHSKSSVTLMVEQKIGLLPVFCTPLLERKIQKLMEKDKKLEQKMFHVKHFQFQQSVKR